MTTIRAEIKAQREAIQSIEREERAEKLTASLSRFRQRMVYQCATNSTASVVLSKDAEKQKEQWKVVKEVGSPYTSKTVTQRLTRWERWQGLCEKECIPDDANMKSLVEMVGFDYDRKRRIAYGCRTHVNVRYE